MADATVGTGSLGSTFQGIVEEISVDAASNSSQVRVRGLLYNNSTATSFNNNNIDRHISGSNAWSVAVPISVAGKTTATIIDQTFTVYHDGNGNATVSYNIGFGATGTSGLGGPTSVNVSLALTHIVLAPGIPGYVLNSALSDTAIRLQWGTPANNGTAISGYLVRVWTAGYNWDTANIYSGLVGGNSLDVGGLSPNTVYYWGVAAYNGVYSAPSNYSTNWWITTAVSVPAAPTAATTTRNTDTSITTSWTNHATSGAPYSSLTIQRKTDGGAWTTLSSSLAGGTTSYTDTTATANHTYQYQVAASNTSGTSAYAAGSAVATTPAAPSSLSGARGTGTSVILTWANNALPDYQTKIQESDGAGGWTDQATLAAGVTTWTDTAPAAGITQYRAAAVNTNGGLQSAWTLSNSVTVITPPNPPTNLGPTAVQVAGATSYPVTWQHNPVDGSAQTKYQIRHRLVGNPTWTEEAAVSSSVSAGAIAKLATFTGQEEWQVQTWGADVSSSGYSASSILTINFKPTATITAPDDPVVLSRTSVSWAYFDHEGTSQAAWQVDLLSGGSVVESKSGTDASTTTDLATALPNGSTWTVRARVRDGAGLWSDYGSFTFTVAYTLPPVPVVYTAWDWTDGVVQLLINNPAPGLGEVDAVAVNVYRDIDGGGYEWIAANVPPNTAITDFGPTVKGTNTYRIEAVSALPSSASVTVAVVTPEPSDGEPSLFLGAGPAFSIVCHAWSNIVISAAADLTERQLLQFAGRKKPLEFSGSSTLRTWDISVDLLNPSSGPGFSSWEEWLELALLPGPFLLRTPEGLYRYVSVKGLSAVRNAGGVVTGVSFTATETDRA